MGGHRIEDDTAIGDGLDIQVVAERWYLGGRWWLPGERVDLDFGEIGECQRPLIPRDPVVARLERRCLFERGSVDMIDPIQDLGRASDCLAVARVLTVLPIVGDESPPGGDVVRVLIEQRIDGLIGTSGADQVVLDICVDAEQRSDDVWLELGVLGWADEMLMGVEYGNLINDLLERLHVMTAFVCVSLMGKLVADAFFLPVQRFVPWGERGVEIAPVIFEWSLGPIGVDVVPFCNLHVRNE